ncbi:MAG: pre-peptidase C-terminal domain-containing protein, partial [Pseudomonadota bacterium]
MCGFCTAAGDSGPGCGPGLGTLRAEFTQPLSTPDIAQNIPGDETSDATIAVGETVNETLEVRNDDDWFAITLSENQTIQIDVAGTGGNALFDPIIRIYDQNGSLVRYFDDGEGPSSSHIWTALADGQYFISVRSYAALYSGDYALSVSAAAPPPPSSLVDVVRGNTSLNQSAPIQVYFAETGDTYSFDGTTYSASGFNAYEEAQLMSIFTGLSEFTTLQFQKTTNRAAADLEWGTATLPSSSQGTLLGFFFFPSFGGNGGYGLLNNNFSGWSSAPGGGMDTGGFMYDVSIHELGHGLGLGHTHDTGNGSTVMPGVA